MTNCRSVWGRDICKNAVYDLLRRTTPSHYHICMFHLQRDDSTIYTFID